MTPPSRDDSPEFHQVPNYGGEKEEALERRAITSVSQDKTESLFAGSSNELNNMMDDWRPENEQAMSVMSPIARCGGTSKQSIAPSMRCGDPASRNLKQ